MLRTFTTLYTFLLTAEISRLISQLVCVYALACVIGASPKAHVLWSRPHMSSIPLKYSCLCGSSSACEAGERALRAGARPHHHLPLLWWPGSFKNICIKPCTVAWERAISLEHAPFACHLCFTMWWKCACLSAYMKHTCCLPSSKQLAIKMRKCLNG